MSVFILLKLDTTIMEEEEEEGTGLRKGGLKRRVVSNQGGLSLEVLLHLKLNWDWLAPFVGFNSYKTT